MTTIKMRNLLTETITEWLNVDEYRSKPSGMYMCKETGFISYPEKILKSEDLTEFYREEYRKAPNSKSLFSGQIKLHYHNAFLAEVLEEFKKRDDLVIGEVGAAFGLFLGFLKKIFPKANLSGTELTRSHRAVAKYEFGVDLQETFDYNKSYDLITSYKVDEHIPNVDLELRKRVECLKPNGYYYISVPTWFNTLELFGGGAWDIDGYYHPNHVNVWTQKMFHSLLNRVGLKIIKEDHVMYNDAYLCVRDDSLMSLPLEFEGPEAILENLKKVKLANDTYLNGRSEDGAFEKATEIWPDFPSAWVNGYEYKRQKFDIAIKAYGWQEMQNYFKKVIEACPNSADVRLFCAHVAIRYENFDDGLKFIEETLAMRPEYLNALNALAEVYDRMSSLESDLDKKYELLNRSVATRKRLAASHLQTMYDSINWIYRAYSLMPV